MRQSFVAVALVAVIAVAGCHKGPKTVPAPPPAPPAPATPPPAPPPSTPEVVPQESEYDRIKKMDSAEIDKLGLLGDIHFDFDKSDLRDEDRQILARNAENLKKFDFIKVTVEGHCDEKGSVEYNLALGERRARAAFDYLVSLGVPAERMKTVSYGKEVPLCSDHTEDCWARNRRAHFPVTSKLTK